MKSKYTVWNCYTGDKLGIATLDDEAVEEARQSDCRYDKDAPINADDLADLIEQLPIAAGRTIALHQI